MADANVDAYVPLDEATFRKMQAGPVTSAS
jgi:hypothetical protein